MPTSTSPQSGEQSPDRPSNREVENENQRPATDGDQGGVDGKPPRPATEPAGAEESSTSPKTRTDPGSGEA